MAIHIGIDPGQAGGIAILGCAGAEAFAMPDTERDAYLLLGGLARPGAVAVIEAVHSMPKQGVASSFKFGRNYGFLRGLLVALAVPFVEVTPHAWQKALGCMSHGDKNVTKARAQQLYPALKITHKTADALLLATYCARLDWRGVSLEVANG